MNVYFNNDLIDLDNNSYLSQIIKQKGLNEKKGIAVAVNNVVIQRSQWTSYLLQENDKILIVTATKGG
jgi:sulfur carrier protein